jgi:hypothetical protein
MTDDKNKTNESGDKSSSNKNDEEQLNVHNPLKEDDDKEITQQDVENEQTFKEAQTERN